MLVHSESQVSGQTFLIIHPRKRMMRETLTLVRENLRILKHRVIKIANQIGTRHKHFTM